MRNRNHLAILILWAGILLLIIAGCAGSPMMVRSATQNELRTISTVDLVRGYSYEKSRTSPHVKAELIRRNLVPLHEWEDIDNHDARMGMSEMGLYLSRGFPSQINTMVGRWGVHKQCIYRMGRYSREIYIYLENGKVVGWQN